MPKKLSEQVVRQLFLDAGYQLPNNFAYVNSKKKHKVLDKFTNEFTRLSLQQLKYKIKRNQRPTFSELPLPYPEPQNDNQPQHVQLSARRRFLNNHSFLNNQPQWFATEIFNIYTELMPKINRKQTFTYDFYDDGSDYMSVQMFGITVALKDSLAKIQKTHDIVLDLETVDGRHRYFHVNAASINDLYEIFNSPAPNFDVTDSADNMLLDTLDYKKVTFNFVQPHTNRHVRAGFFPFINTTTDDLSRYGIYTNINDERITEPCILTAFKASNVFTDNEINEIDDMIRVKNFPQAELKNISKSFKINIYVRHYKQNNQTSHVEFADKSYTRSLKLMIFYDHYMLLEQVNARQSSYTLIKQMITKKQLRPMTDKELNTVFTKIFTTSRPTKPYNNCRLIHVPDQTKRYPLTCFNQYFFGYTPDADEVEMRLNELQQFVNTLNLRHHVDVRCYKRFSMLMQKIMYEYGCFDGVYELTGEKRDEIRNSLVFPTRQLTTDTINEKCYYLDFNGAYCSFMTNIPSGVDDTCNTKIKELIEIMYAKRLNAKQEHNDKFAKTLKFIMCSCYGASITRPKLFKNKHSTNVQGTIREHGDLVVSHNEQGFVTIKRPLVEHYNHPQFAKVILDGFNAKCDEIKSLVNVLFQNFDAFIVNEADYNKLNSLGYIHPTELGKLKVEHVFQSVTFKNKCQWIGINEDGTEFRHCM
ncbi:MAG: hypothetical protein IKO56_09095 [Alphaproteobacteria bacterium]|nr:hypothetical protein [Alphaproteobacteria bacterium]